MRACCWLISLAEKEKIAQQTHGVILKVQLSKKAGLTNTKACLAFLKQHPWGIIIV